MNRLITNTDTTNFYNHITELLHNCNSFVFNVAFINFSGVQLLLDSFKLLEEKNIKGKILTSTYLNFTDPKALEKINEFKNIELKIFNSELSNKGFHPKVYIFEFDGEYKTIIGSSNITASAFKSNIEWNLQSINKKDDILKDKIFNEFNNLWEKSFYVDNCFLDSYTQYRKNIKYSEDFIYKKNIKPNKMQKESLERLEYLRSKGEKKALAVAATGSGKTYLAALDVKSSNPERMLFLVHRENILLKSKESFESVIPNRSCGLYTGNRKEKDCEYIFSTIQTMSNTCEEFLKEEFDYIIIDEAHHISSPSYQKVLKYLRPGFLLGLTATPNRMDGENIYSYFDDNIACDISLNDALEYDLVVPFHYYGISDIKTIDYTGLDILKLNEIAKLLMVNKRVDYIIEKLDFYSYCGAKRKVLGFCASKEHASYMSKEFNKRGIASIALTSIDSIEKREQVIKRLEDEQSELQVIFSVDIFNEGVDVPSINTVLMLRPTNSPIVFIQQLGRGLRRYKGKEFLTLLDFIGNHNRGYLIALALVGDRKIDKESIKLSLLNNFANIPNAHVSMDKISRQRILEQIENENFNSFKYLKEQYQQVKSKTISIPKMADYLEYKELVSPLNFISESKSYIEFIARVEKTDELKRICTDDNFLKAIRFIEFLLPAKRIYEFVFIKYLLYNDSLTIESAKEILSKYLIRVNEDTLKHSFEYINGNYFDKSQISRYLKLAKIEGRKLVRTKEFGEILNYKLKKEFIKESLEYGIVLYEKSFGLEDYGMPFLKPYEKYNMLNVALVCNFNKIHTSFRGSGFLKFNNDFFLFITIEKDKLSTALKYNNDFLSKDRFSFVSKPGHSKDKGDGQRLCQNKEFGIKLHIFARKFAQVDKKTQNFIYLGLADTIDHKGDRPVTVQLKLRKPLSDKLYEEFTKIV